MKRGGLREVGLDFPIKNLTLRKQAAKEDLCPQCGGELDTGMECNKCHYDASDDLVREIYPYPAAKVEQA